MDDEDNFDEATEKRLNARGGPDMDGCSPLIHISVSKLAVFSVYS
jgi:hypothetical protein